MSRNCTAFDGPCPRIFNEKQKIKAISRLRHEERGTRIVQLLAGKKPTRTKGKMKKAILLAVLLVGAGVATSKAGVAFGINIGGGRGYVGGGYASGGCAPPSYGYGYSQPSYGAYGYSGQYRYTSGCGEGYAYGPHDALHDDLRAQHADLHQDLREQHQDQ